jgi:hypothetical protein
MLPDTNGVSALGSIKDRFEADMNAFIVNFHTFKDGNADIQWLPWFRNIVQPGQQE